MRKTRFNKFTGFDDAYYSTGVVAALAMSDVTNYEAFDWNGWHFIALSRNNKIACAALAGVIACAAGKCSILYSSSDPRKDNKVNPDE